jgi:hypothetical protein
VFYDEGDEQLTNKERMLKELHSRRTEEELYALLDEALLKLRNENGSGKQGISS